jgi:hypothetical protein
MSNKKNIDNTRSGITEDPNSWSSPKAGDGDGIVKFESDDLYPARKERLGQYLSDTTMGYTGNPDAQVVFGEGHQPFMGKSIPRSGNDFPIGAPGVPTVGFTMDPLWDLEKQIFEAVGEENFSSELISETISILLQNNPSLKIPIAKGSKNIKLGIPGHWIVRAAGEALVAAQITAAKINPKSRWAGISVKKFPEFGSDDKLERVGDALGRWNPMKTAGQRWKPYVHKNHMTTLGAATSIKAPLFWKDYYNTMSYVGKKITMDSVEAKAGTRKKFFDEATSQYLPSEPQIELQNIYPESTFGNLPNVWAKTKIDIETKEKAIDSNQVSLGAKLKEGIGLSGPMSYGQAHSWANPFLTTSWDPWRVEVPDEEISKLSSGGSLPSAPDKSTDSNPDPFPYPRLNTDLEDKDNTDWGSKYGPNKRKYRSRGIDGLADKVYRRIELDKVGDSPTLRMASTRRKIDNKFRTSTTTTPSLMLLPKSLQTIKNNLVTYGIDSTDTGAPQSFKLEGYNSLWRGDEKENELAEIDSKFKSTNRFRSDQVRLIEDQLEAEYMPFYIQDLRTNEIISFHAFLESIEDSYSAEWSEQKGFGRIEAAQIYGGGSRSIGVSFTIIPTDQEDFDDMWIKINKLTTLVYPQWSEGTLMQNGENKFIQPFSQVPTASPLCRIRVGDLFTSNYSKTNMARMMGIGNAQFKYTENPPDENAEADHETTETQTKTSKAKASDRYMKKSFFDIYTDDGGDGTASPAYLALKANDKAWQGKPKADLAKLWSEEQTSIIRGYQYSFKTYKARWEANQVKWTFPGTTYEFTSKASLQTYLSMTAPVEEGEPPGLAASEIGSGGISALFSSIENPIFKSFESTMGRGIAVAINSIGLDWKLNSAPWNLEPGHRAPRMCTVSLGLVPIHDITPGLDHEGFNRAPIYTVGNSMKSVGGDPWYNNQEYNDLINEINTNHLDSLKTDDGG